MRTSVFFGSGLGARQRADDVDHGGDVLLAESHCHEFIVKLDGTVEHGGSDAKAVGERTYHVEIVLQRRRRALWGKKAPLRHPRGADAELRRATATAGDCLDHEVDVDTGFKPERH